MKKIFCLLSLLTSMYSTWAQYPVQNQPVPPVRNTPLVYPAQQPPYNNNSSVILNNTYNNNTSRDISNTINNSLKPNTMFENNSQFYNGNNNQKNKFPQDNGTYYTPGSQGINNGSNPNTNGSYSLPPAK
jgi:hypothetical protein